MVELLEQVALAVVEQLQLEFPFLPLQRPLVDGDLCYTGIDLQGAILWLDFTPEGVVLWRDDTRVYHRTDHGRWSYFNPELLGQLRELLRREMGSV